MGDSVNNFYEEQHQPVGGAVEFRLRRHLGNANIDTTSPACNLDDYKAVRDAALTGTDTQLSNAGGAAWGSWWVQNVIQTGLLGHYRGMIQARY